MALKDFLTILKPKKVGRPSNEPSRDTIAWPNLALLGQNPTTQAQRVVFKATPRNIRYFSHTPMARRAINAIKHPLSQLEWEIALNQGVTMNSELQRQIEVATQCLSLPNDDDSFDSLLMQLVDDICCGAGVLEIGLSKFDDRPVYLWPVDGLSVHIYPGWRGGTHEARYLQTIGYGGAYSVGFTPGIKLRNDEIMYIRPNPSSASPFGVGPMEIAFNSISNQLATAKFAAKLAGNALPPFMLDLGEVSSRVVQTWRSYWTNDVEGEGKIPIIGSELVDGQAGAGKTRGLSVQRLYPEGDKALYLAYQEFLRTEIASAFDISNMSLNVERDVNRSCYSEDTETLTIDGWKGLDELSSRSLVAVYNPQTGSIEYQEPTLFHVAPYEGDMVHVSGRMTDSLVTPDHRMWVRNLGQDGSSKTRPDSAGFGIVAAEALTSGIRYATVATFKNDPQIVLPDRYTIPGCTLGGGILREYPDRTVAMDDWLAILGFWIAEGHAKRYGNGTWKVNLSQNPGPTADWVDALLCRTPFAWSPNDDSTCRRWQVADKALCQHLIAECSADGGISANSHTKRLPQWVLLLPLDKMKIVFDALMSGDGTRDSREDRRSGIYYTSSPHLRDDVQLLATFLGHRSVVTMEPIAGVYRVKITDDCPENEIRHSNITRVPYKGRVYCFAVPPHSLFVTRRNGKIAVHGNTADVVAEREWVQAIRPMARMIAGGLTRKIIWQAMGFTSIHFRWKGVDREDLEKMSQILVRYIGVNALTPNEVRKKIGEPPTDSVWGDLMKADIDIAVSAAKGVAIVDDPDLNINKARPPVPPKPPAKKISASFEDPEPEDAP